MAAPRAAKADAASRVTAIGPRAAAKVAVRAVPRAAAKVAHGVAVVVAVAAASATDKVHASAARPALPIPWATPPCRRTAAPQRTTWRATKRAPSARRVASVASVVSAVSATIVAIVAIVAVAVRGVSAIGTPSAATAWSRSKPTRVRTPWR